MKLRCAGGVAPAVLGLGGWWDRRGPGAAIRGAPILQTNNRPSRFKDKRRAPIWTTPYAWRATANHTLGMAMVRALPAPRPACLCGRRYPMGARCFQRQAAHSCTLYELRQQRCNTPASRLGRQSYRVLSVSNRGRSVELLLSTRGVVTKTARPMCTLR